MIVLRNSVPYQMAKAMEKASKGSAYDDKEEKLIIRFERGKDFNTEEEFYSSFLSILIKSKQEWGKRQVDRMRILAAHPPAQTAGVDMGIPIDSLDFEKVRSATQNSSSV